MAMLESVKYNTSETRSPIAFLTSSAKPAANLIASNSLRGIERDINLLLEARSLQL